jgi:hypothetical protein
MKNTTTTAEQTGIPEPVICPEYLGDIAVEVLLGHLTNFNPHFNTMPLLKAYLKGLRLSVTADYEFAPDPTDPTNCTKHLKTFTIELDDPNHNLEAQISHALAAKYYKGAPGSPRWL